ncbi:right-handed parallel beta-helix repeat-containing protein [Chitinophaga alhagiae]|uniref:Right-handed parallel beta-helix repeat-containing protein n=1 Tax=Chitinophaga alhagiae TaxID=2203219 RepID=A0ABN5LM45_9BACT|nr:right-handed parallel beta-helix repeat-containing protein [Chitinophaga alhagiae]AWO00314.1 right-handed parallel beta-helix repeat-containing protein [Chitinophaga alhagiae]
MMTHHIRNISAGLAATLLMLIFTPGSVYALPSGPVAIYVSPSGNNVNPGTAARPLATLAAARDHARQLRGSGKATGPLEIILLPGTYLLRETLELTAEDGGTAAAPLVFRGQGKTPPVVSGAEKLPPFEKVNDRLWKTRVTQDIATVQQLFVNGARTTLARTPNAEQWFRTGRVTETVTAPGATQKVHLTQPQWEALRAVPDAALAQVIVSIHHAWDRTRKYLQARSAADTSFTISGRPMKPWNKLDNASQFIFENAVQFLDAQGEWFLQPDGVLLYVPRQGEHISTAVAEVPVLEQFVAIRGDSARKATHIRFENIAFRYTRHNMPRTGQEPVQAASPMPAAVMADYADNIVFHNCEIAHTGNNAIWFRKACTNSKITHCYLHDLGIGAVKIGAVQEPAHAEAVTRHITVDNNILRSGGHVVPTGVGVTIFHSSDNIISHNEIADFRYSGVSVGWIWGYKHSYAKRNQIVFNHIHHLGWGLLSDMGGVYTLGPSEGTTVSHNVVHHVYSYGYGGWGLYTDEGSTGIVMENNLVYRCKSSGFHQHYGRENQVRNNIFASQIKAQLEATRVEDHRSFHFVHNIVYMNEGILIDKRWAEVHFAADSNLYWNAHAQGVRFGRQDLAAWQASTGKDKHSIAADPGFTDVTTYNFHIKNKAAIEKIGFQPFDYSKAGVYGTAAWKQLAAFDPQLAERFDRMVKARETGSNGL